MGKRSNFERVPERDFYPTPAEAAVPLLRHLAADRLLRAVRGRRRPSSAPAGAGHFCTYAFDIAPRGRIHEGDATNRIEHGRRRLLHHEPAVGRGTSSIR
jgi:hypothetical protein